MVLCRLPRVLGRLWRTYDYLVYTAIVVVMILSSIGHHANKERADLTTNEPLLIRKSASVSGQIQTSSVENDNAQENLVVDHGAVVNLSNVERYAALPAVAETDMASDHIQRELLSEIAPSVPELSIVDKSDMAFSAKPEEVGVVTNDSINGRSQDQTPQSVPDKRKIGMNITMKAAENASDSSDEDGTGLEVPEDMATMQPVTFRPGDLRQHPVNAVQSLEKVMSTKNNSGAKLTITDADFASLYDFSPFYTNDDELMDKDKMDYVKGLGYMYIYNNATFVNHVFNEKAPMKTILLYNPFYDDEDYKFGMGHKPFVEHFCTINKCRTTDDRKELATADMVIFFAHGLDFTRPDILPDRAHPEQIFVFWNHESPFYRTRNKLRRFRTVFNMTVTYRTDSSIPLPLYQTRARVNRNPKAKVTEYHIRDRTKLAVWMISACHKIGSLRFPYVNELKKHMHVDTYGSCGNLTCNRDQTAKCLSDMERTYKFYLAFENSMCKDYITEKPFRTLQFGNWVPVVMGGGDYARHMPPHSFIDVRDFRSPRHLAEYLKYLDRNDREYLKYFDWKLDWLIWRVHTKVALCQLCEILHGKGREKVRSDLNIHDWWETGGECVPPENLAKHVNLVRYT